MMMSTVLESSDPGLSNEPGLEKIHRATAEQELLEVGTEIRLRAAASPDTFDFSWAVGD